MFVQIKTLVVLILALSLAGGWVRAQNAQPTEYRVKAGFVFNFAKFVEWPPAAFTNESAPFIIGVLGQAPIAADLEQTVNGKQIGTHPILVRTFRAVEEARQCHILFIGESESARLPDIFKSLRETTVLTVGETPQFISAGGMINFIAQETDKETRRFRFQINDETAKAARLKISSKLLSLAVQPAQ